MARAGEAGGFKIVMLSQREEVPRLGAIAERRRGHGEAMSAPVIRYEVYRGEQDIDDVMRLIEKELR